MPQLHKNQKNKKEKKQDCYKLYYAHLQNKIWMQLYFPLALQNVATRDDFLCFL